MTDIIMIKSKVFLSTNALSQIFWINDPHFESDGGCLVDLLMFSQIFDNLHALES